MDFDSGIRNLRSGRAIKRPCMVGYVERVMVTAAETAPENFDSTVAYTTNQKVRYNGLYYKAKSNTTAGTLPTDTTKWDVYKLAPEHYKLVFHNRAGSSFSFFYNGTGDNATNLSLTKELLGHFVENDWIEDDASKFAEAADSSSSNEW